VDCHPLPRRSSSSVAAEWRIWWDEIAGRSGSRQILADLGDVGVGGVTPVPSPPVMSVLVDDEHPRAAAR
jgi:hypothetical protein